MLTLGEQDLGMIGLFDVLMAVIAADMTGDEFPVVIGTNPVRINLDGQAAVSIVSRDRVMVSVDGETELAAGCHSQGAGIVIGIGVERPQLEFLFQEQIAGALARFSMTTDIGDGVEPEFGGCIGGDQVIWFTAIEEVLLDISHA